MCRIFISDKTAEQKLSFSVFLIFLFYKNIKKHLTFWNSDVMYSGFKQFHERPVSLAHRFSISYRNYTAKLEIHIQQRKKRDEKATQKLYYGGVSNRNSCFDSSCDLHRAGYP